MKRQIERDFITSGAHHYVCNNDLRSSVGCGEACPNVPGLQREDWPLPDPKGKADDEVGKIRDEIKVRVLRLLNNLNALECSL